MLFNPMLEKKEPTHHCSWAFANQRNVLYRPKWGTQEKSRSKGLLAWIQWQRNYENSCGNYNSATPWHMSYLPLHNVLQLLSSVIPRVPNLWLHIMITWGAFKLPDAQVTPPTQQPKMTPGGLAGISIRSRSPDLSKVHQSLGTIELD